MKKIIILLTSFVFIINIYGKTRVYTTNDHAYLDIGSAYLALALLKAEYHDLLFTLLDDTNERLVLISNLKPDNDLELLKIKKKPNSLTDKEVVSIFKSIKVEFLKSDTIFCLVLHENLYHTKAQRDYERLNRYQLPIFNSSWFQRAVKASGAKTHDEKIQALKEWIDKVMKQPIRASSDPWKLL